MSFPETLEQEGGNILSCTNNVALTKSHNLLRGFVSRAAFPEAVSMRVSSRKHSLAAASHIAWLRLVARFTRPGCLVHCRHVKANLAQSQL